MISELFTKINNELDNNKKYEDSPNLKLEKSVVMLIENHSESYSNRGKQIAMNKINIHEWLDEFGIFLSGKGLRNSKGVETKVPDIETKDSLWNMIAINNFINDYNVANIKQKLLVYYQTLRPHNDVFPYDSVKFLNFKILYVQNVELLKMLISLI